MSHKWVPIITYESNQVPYSFAFEPVPYYFAFDRVAFDQIVADVGSLPLQVISACGKYGDGHTTLMNHLRDHSFCKPREKPIPLDEEPIPLEEADDLIPLSIWSAVFEVETDTGKLKEKCAILLVKSQGFFHPLIERHVDKFVLTLIRTISSVIIINFQQFIGKSYYMDFNSLLPNFFDGWFSNRGVFAVRDVEDIYSMKLCCKDINPYYMSIFPVPQLCSSGGYKLFNEVNNRVTGSVPGFKQKFCNKDSLREAFIHLTGDGEIESEEEIEETKVENTNFIKTLWVKFSGLQWNKIVTV